MIKIFHDDIYQPLKQSTKRPWYDIRTCEHILETFFSNKFPWNKTDEEIGVENHDVFYRCIKSIEYFAERYPPPIGSVYVDRLAYVFFLASIEFFLNDKYIQACKSIRNGLIFSPCNNMRFHQICVILEMKVIMEYGFHGISVSKSMAPVTEFIWKERLFKMAIEQRNLSEIMKEKLQKARPNLKRIWQRVPLDMQLAISNYLGYIEHHYD